MNNQFKAEWISSDGAQPEDQFEPELVEYSCEFFDTQKKAENHARKMAEKCGVADDWWRVEEQEYVPYIYRGIDIGRFETIATWISGEYISDNY